MDMAFIKVMATPMREDSKMTASMATEFLNMKLEQNSKEIG